MNTHWCHIILHYDCPAPYNVAAVNDVTSRSAQSEQHNVGILFFFLFFFLSLCLGPLIRMVLDMISAGLDNGYTFLALPYAPHDTGSCPALLPHHSGNYPYSSRMVSLMTSRRTPSRMLKEVTRPPPSLAEQDMPIWDYLMYPVAVGLDQLSHFVYLP